MSNPFFDNPILDSPYEYPKKHWELDEQGQPTQKIIEKRRSAKFITPIPKPKKQRGGPAKKKIIFNEGKGLSDEKQQYVKSMMEGKRKLVNGFQIGMKLGEIEDLLEKKA
ncbi:MAG: hypothetical protein MUO31_01280 [Thermodesulfovibrionales bacterium]|nr:hypothetical protein [Thermodesulfovibrionales bacterium]